MVRSDEYGVSEGRNETADERYDRNWVEILQELRVTQTGTQIISGFLLTLAFQQRFSDLDTFQVAVYVVLVLLAAVSTCLGLTPVSLHRTLFRRHEKRRIVVIGNRLLKATLVAVSVLTAGVVLFILDVVVGRIAGVIAGVTTLVFLGIMLLLMPRLAGASR
ncbi:DUF6328 family protein [Parafrigoribacterium mesophilum]|uniref:DUF6328 family protein n=1 Tax=Parafrigoribacterium mesophilum TaxID=433646 RepID=UPI0031FBEEE6